MDQLFAGAVISILSAGLGFLAAHSQRRTARSERRASVATVLLVELSWLEYNLRARYDHPKAADSTRRVVAAGLDLHQQDFPLFRPSTVRRLLTFRGLVRDIEISQENLSEASEELNRSSASFL